MWLETVLLIETAVAFWLAALNVTLLCRLASSAQARPRRTAAAVLACVCAGQALEALLFLWQGATATGSVAAAAMLLVRTALLASSALVSALLLRASSRSR